MRDQKKLVHEVLDEKGWIIFLDGARLDYGAELIPQYLDMAPNTVEPVNNRNIAYTGDWCQEMLDGDWPDLGCFSPSPLRDFADPVKFDSRDHFGTVPDPSEYDETDVKDRLAALGYLEKTSSWGTGFEKTTDVAKTYLDKVDGGIVRAVRPHPPLIGLEDVTGGSGKLGRTKKAVIRGDLSRDELRDAYKETYRAVLKTAADLIRELDGRVVITSDHGEALMDDCCNQIFHARSHVKCGACLTTVPWAEVRS